MGRPRKPIDELELANDLTPTELAARRKLETQGLDEKTLSEIEQLDKLIATQLTLISHSRLRTKKRNPLVADLNLLFKSRAILLRTGRRRVQKQAVQDVARELDALLEQDIKRPN